MGGDMWMLLFVLDDTKKLDEVLQAWTDIGITGATIIESSGLYRHQEAKELVPAYYYLPSAGYGIELSSYTLLSMVQEEEVIQKALQEVEAIVGDLSEPNTGVFAAWPIQYVKGVPGKPAMQEGFPRDVNP